MSIVAIIGATISGMLGRYLAGALQQIRSLASDLAREADCQVPPSTNLFILRKIGDEASLALGAGQFLSWATTRAYAHLAAQKKLRRSRRFISRSVLALCGTALVVFVPATGWIIFQEVDPIVVMSDFYKRVPGEYKLGELALVTGWMVSILGLMFALLIISWRSIVTLLQG